MTERQKAQRFVKQLKKEYPQYFWYKIGDTFGGHKRPCDMLACVEGRFIAVEFKNRDGRLSDNQEKESFKIIRSKGRAYVGTFDGNDLLIEEFNNRDLVISRIMFEKGKYQNLYDLLTLLTG